MWRLGLVVVALIGSAPPALAQNWAPWPGYSGGFLGGSQQIKRLPKATAQAKPNRSARLARPSNDDDDDDFFGTSSSTKPGGQLPYQKSLIQYPTVLQGGPRPDISPKAPQTVAFHAGFAPGSIVIDTGSRALYYVQSGGSAFRYPISVGRDGFRWKGTEKISRVSDWPDWHPPQEMRVRDPKLPEVMTGGIRNPLGAKALYLGNSLYRIHGTNDARSIGYAASSGCFRMMNFHVAHLATLAGPGTTVHVLEHLPSALASVAKPKAKRQG